MIAFPPFQLDPANARLYRQGEVVPLRRKTIATLHYLAARPDRLVTKDELLEALWPGVYVSEATLAGCIRELRRALGDERRKPQFIETVHGMGYRFVGTIAAPAGTAGNRPERADRQAQKPIRFTPPREQNAGFASSGPLGRAAEIEALTGAWADAQRGERRLVFVTGEAGIGKTTLVEAFLRSANNAAVGRGQCIEQYGEAEPFLPLLDALAGICRAAPDTAPAALRAHAPGWMAQVDSAGNAGAAAELAPGGPSPERMLRMLTQALEVLSRETPLVLVLEDLHWSDHSTLSFLSCVAQRTDPARLLVVGTYRPVDAILRQHPLHGLRHELRTRGRALDVSLRFLGESDILHWLEQRLPGAANLGPLAAWVHRQTEGNPLFMTAVLDDLMEHGLIERQDSDWVVHPGYESANVPESLKLIIEQQIDRLDADEQKQLEAASAVGADFSAATVAAAQADVHLVEDTFNALARCGRLVRETAPVEWPNGTIASGYAFIHSLYQQVLYGRIGAAQKVQLHRRIGERLESAYAAQPGQVAAALARHFELGREPARSIRHLESVTQNAIARTAVREVTTVARHGLALLGNLPQDQARDQVELRLHQRLAMALMAMPRYGAPEIGDSLRRALELSEKLGLIVEMFSGIAGLCGFHLVRAELDAADELARRMISISEMVGTPEGLDVGYDLGGATAFLRGELGRASELLEKIQGVELPPMPMMEPRLVRDIYGGLILTLTGHPDQGRQRMAAARARGAEIASRNPVAAMNVPYMEALHAFILREPDAARTNGEAAIAIAAENGLELWGAKEAVLGWADIQQGRVEQGVAAVQRSLADAAEAGGLAFRSSSLAVLAEGLGRLGRAKDALSVIDEGLAHGEESNERLFEPEIWRLKGTIVTDAAEAEACIERAVEIARTQNAKWWELRATVDLCRLLQSQGRIEPARTRLGELCEWFTEGSDTVDLQEARALLAELGG